MSRKFKRFVSLCLAMVVVLNTMLVAYAQPNSARDSEGISDAEIMSEINRYMEKQNLEYELKNQIHTYTIPLSNGEVAFVTHELKKSSRQPKNAVVAKLGEWDFISKYKVARKGSIKVTTTVDITHVPDMTSSDLDMVEFTAYDGRVEATPFQLVSISGSDASTEEVYSNSWYETKGYVGFEAGGLSLNYYFTQKIAFAGNTGSKRNKINVSMKVGV